MPRSVTIADLTLDVKKIQQQFKIVGRERELKLLLIALNAGKNVILEGAVGTGKTFLAHSLASHMDSNFYRIDGSEDVLSHTLMGFFDPPSVITKGYVEDSFVYGPLSQAMNDGGCLFINELNRVPESTQNILLSALDERNLIIPKLKTISAVENDFVTIATQNPAAHVGVSALGEALKDRFVWIHIDYQPEIEEIDIVMQNMSPDYQKVRFVSTIAVKIIDATREHPEIRRGASIRGAIDLAQLIQSASDRPGESLWEELAVMALNSKIELIDGSDHAPSDIIREITRMILEDFQ